MKLLIVDDSALVRRSIESVYSGQKFTEIKTASDGLLAVTLYKEFCPDVVTLDITMPYMDGLAALTEMLSFNKRSKILIISALADHHTAIEALKRGADQFICKPFSDDDLREALDDLVFKEDTSQQSDTRKGTERSERDAQRDLLEKTRMVSNEIKRRTAENNARPASPEDYPSGYVEPPSIIFPDKLKLLVKPPQPMRPPIQ